MTMESMRELLFLRVRVQQLILQLSSVFHLTFDMVFEKWEDGTQSQSYGGKYLRNLIPLRLQQTLSGNLSLDFLTLRDKILTTQG